MNGPELSIIYEVRIRRTENRGRVVVSLHRDDLEYSKDLAHCEEDELVFLSKKPRHFFDRDDEEKVLRHCLELVEERGKTERVGSVELFLFLSQGPRVEVKFVGDILLAKWTPLEGLVFEEDAHPIFKKDKDAIALACWQVPQGSGGVLGPPEGPAEDVFESVLKPRRRHWRN